MKRAISIWVAVMLCVLSCMSAQAQEQVDSLQSGAVSAQNEAIQNEDLQIQDEQAQDEMAEEEKEWWNILFLGGDSRSANGYRLTDAMMIISINREECLIKMTSIMRDTWVEYPELEVSNKINAANVYGGPELSIETVNRYFGTDIEKYVMVNMHDLVKIVDLVGGIDLWVSESERYYINQAVDNYLSEIGSYSGRRHLDKAGEVHLNGLQAVAYTRNRSTDNDYGRVIRQRKMLLALAESMQNMEVNELMEKVGQIIEYVQTNLDNEQMKELAMVGLAMEIEDVEQFRVPADDTYESGMMKGTWKIVADFEANRQLLHDFIYGVEAEETEADDGISAEDVSVEIPAENSDAVSE